MNMNAEQFKPWAGPWLIRICICLLLVPNLLLFTISTASIPAACGYYGIDPNDANYTLIVLYAALVGFFPLERRFSAYLVTKDYLLISLILEVATTYGAYLAQDLATLLIFRVLQGIANICLVAICISLIFNHLKTERSREIGYSVVYCILLCITPLTIFLTSSLVSMVNYNELYLAVMFAFVPGGLLVAIIMQRQRLNRKIPLYLLDWQSFIIYGTALFSLTYVLVYGQQLNWFANEKIITGTILFTVTITVYVSRQLHLKRPYLRVGIFKFPAFRTGVILIIILYLARGGFNLTTLYFTQVLGMDPVALGQILAFNIAGAITGSLISSRLLIYKRAAHLIWICGFTILLVHHVWMIYLFAPQANFSTYYLPLFIQGLGAGMLLTPIIVHMVTSVPPEYGPTAGATAVSIRLLGTTVSIAALNYFQLFGPATHFDRFQEHLGAADPTAIRYINAIGKRAGHFVDTDGQITAGSLHRLKSLLDQQAFLKTAVDYYTLISFLLMGTIIVLALLPALKVKRTAIDPVRDIPI